MKCFRILFPITHGETTINHITQAVWPRAAEGGGESRHGYLCSKIILHPQTSGREILIRSCEMSELKRHSRQSERVWLTTLNNTELFTFIHPKIIAAWDGSGQCCQTHECQLNKVGKLNKSHHSLSMSLWFGIKTWLVETQASTEWGENKRSDLLMQTCFASGPKEARPSTIFIMH